MKPCLDCGRSTTGSRCPACYRVWDRARRPSGGARYGRAFLRARRALLASATVCRICGLPARPGDPLTAGHDVARVRGGTERDGLGAEHRTCNARRGARW